VTKPSPRAQFCWWCGCCKMPVHSIRPKIDTKHNIKPTRIILNHTIIPWELP
jgi:hypothetical protein